MQIAKGYKQTEVGVIPDDWECISIQNLIDSKFILGHLDGNHGELYPRSEEFTNFGVPYITANDLTGHLVSFSNCKFLPEHRARKFRKGISINGDVLFAHNATVGPTALLYTNLDYVILSTTATYFRCNHETLNNQFFLHSLQSPLFIPQYTAVMSQSTRNQVPIGAQRKLLIPLPPTKAEQEAIAVALSDADSLIESLQQLIAKKRQIKQGAMQELLSPKPDWVEKTFDEVFSFHSTATNSRSDLSEQGDCFYIHYGDIHTKFHSHLNFKIDSPPRISRSKCKGATAIKNGDWIMADASEDYDGVGKSVEVTNLPEGVSAVAGLHTFLLREKEPYFVEGFKGHLGNLKSLHEEFLRVATGMKVYGVSKAALRGLSVPIPPTSEQTRIATILSDMDEEITTLETKLTKAQQIKQGMMSELLTGKTRLI